MSGEEYDHRFVIRVALKILFEISNGIYRDLAGALKEMVSNSFDAEATDVRIHTDAPRFDQITVRDNGRGMTGDFFERAFTNVGLSQKMLHPELYRSELNRPTIGRFGIGFLAAAHISSKIHIESFTDTEKPGIQAEMDLDPYFRYMDKVETFDKFKYGDVVWGSLENPGHERGTVVTLEHVTKSKFHQVISRPGLKFVDWPAEGEFETEPCRAMEGLVRGFLSSSKLSTKELSGREQILWNLGVSCPVEYLDAGPVLAEVENNEARQVISELKAKTASFQFRVWYDGVQVRKPILQPTPRPEAKGLEELDENSPKDVMVWPIRIHGAAPEAKPVSASGYLLYQPYRLMPQEMRGLLPRVRGVGIGASYENSLLVDFKGERPLYRVQMSGELYIDDGFDDVLNLDRSSFLEMKPEFQYLSSELSKAVRVLILDADRVSRGRRRRRERIRSEVEETARIGKLESLLNEAGVDYGLSRISGIALTKQGPFDYRVKSAYPRERPIVVIDHGRRQVKVHLDVEWPEWLAIAVFVDRMLGRLPNSSTLRVEFAEYFGKAIEMLMEE